ARVVREKPRIERLEAAPAARARALGREELFAATAGTRDAHHVAAELERLRKRIRQRGAVRRGDLDLADGQVDVVLLEAAQARPLGRRRHDAVDAQRRKTALRGPLRELRVIALAADHERRVE